MSYWKYAKGNVVELLIRSPSLSKSRKITQNSIAMHAAVYTEFYSNNTLAEMKLIDSRCGTKYETYLRGIVVHMHTSAHELGVFEEFHLKDGAECEVGPARGRKMELVQNDEIHWGGD